MTKEGKINSDSCGGLIAINPLQIPSQKSEMTAAVSVKRKPTKNWHPPMVLWYCGNFGQKKGKPRQYCSHKVNDELGIKNVRSRCLMCRQFGRKSKQKHWDSLMIKDARNSDRKRLLWPEKKRPFNKIDWDRYITREYIRKVYKVCRGLCWWCGIYMNKEERKRTDGLTIERLTNQPHYINTCVVSCYTCNRKSWRKNKLTSYFTGRPSQTSDKLQTFQKYLLSWELHRKLLLELDSRHH